MNFLVSFFFGAGVAAFTYSKLGRRIGYGNQKDVWLIVGVAFVLSLIFFYTLMTFVLHIH
jgi:hypothetical protein